MAKFDGFEDTDAWKKAYSVTMQVYRITDSGKFSKDFGLRDQIRRAAVSIMANIAEGHGRKSNTALTTLNGPILTNSIPCSVKSGV